MDAAELRDLVARGEVGYDCNVCTTLETLLGRPVDLVMRRAVKNKFFLQAAEQHSELMYAA